MIREYREQATPTTRLEPTMPWAMLQRFPYYAPIMPSCIPLCSKYAHIKFCIGCSIRVPNVPVTVPLGYFNIRWLSYYSILIFNYSFLHNVAVYVFFCLTALHTSPFWIMQNRQGFSFSDNQSTKKCVCYADIMFNTLATYYAQKIRVL